VLFESLHLGPKSFSAACAAPKSATITTLRANICSATRKRTSSREDNRRHSNGEQVNQLAGLALKAKRSVDSSDYWQRHVASE
jgi:hypothetical protein